MGAVSGGLSDGALMAAGMLASRERTAGESQNHGRADCGFFFMTCALCRGAGASGVPRGVLMNVALPRVLNPEWTRFGPWAIAPRSRTVVMALAA